MGIGKVIQHKPHVTTDHRVCACAWDRAAGKATIRPEFSLSALSTDGVGLEICSVSCSWWLAASSRKPGFLPALQRKKDHYDPRPAEKAALLFPCPAKVVGGCGGGGLSSAHVPLRLQHQLSSTARAGQCRCFSMPRQGARAQWDSADGIQQSQHEPVM